MSRARQVGGLLLVAGGTALLFVVSRGKWSDPLIDSGREWIVPDALARGELLYRDVVYWFGPFTPYFQAAFLSLFGSNFGSLVFAGAVAAVGTLAALSLALGRVGPRREALLWCALAVPALVFMPNAGGALLGMGFRIWHAAAFALLAVFLGTRPSARPAAFAAAGALSGLSALCRTEWGLATAAAVVLVAFKSGKRPAAKLIGAGAALAGFVMVFGAVIGFFVLAAGPRAVLEEGHLLFSRLPEETRTFLVAFSGVRDWRHGIVELLYSAAMWTGFFLLVEMLGLGGKQPEARRFYIRWLCAIGSLLVIAAIAGGAGGAVIWSAGPAVSAAALLLGAIRLRRPRGRALAALGLLGLVLSYRRPFHIGDSAYVGPPLLFAFASAAGILRLRVARIRLRAGRRRVRSAFALAIVVLVAGAFVARLQGYARWEAVPIRGTGGLLTARKEIAAEIEELAVEVRAQTPGGGTLVVFPEGELLNFLSERDNPIRHKLYLPGYLTRQNEADVLRELQDARPSAIVLWRRPTSEYGPGMFGTDYGVGIRAWIDAEYLVRPFRAPGGPSRSHSRFLLGLRKARQ